MRLSVIILTLAALTFFSAIIGGGLYYYSLKEVALEESENNAVSQAVIVKNRVSAFIAENMRSARLLSNYHELKRFLNIPTDSNREAANAILESTAQMLDNCICYLMDADGNTVASSNRSQPDSFVGKNYAFRPYFRTSIKGTDSVYMGLGITSGKRGIYTSVPIYDYDGRHPVGVVVVKASAAALEWDLIGDSVGIWVLTEKNGIIFASNRNEWLFQRLWHLDAKQLARLKASQQFGSGPWQWVGLKRDGQSYVIGPARNRYLINEVEVGNCPDWRVLYLVNPETLFETMHDPLLAKSTYLVLLLSLLICVLTTWLYRYGQADLSRRRAVEEALRSSEERFRIVFHTSPDPIHITRLADGRFIDVNEGFIQVTGYCREEVIGKTSQDLDIWAQPRDRSRFVDHITRNGTAENLEFQFRLKNGQIITTLMSACRIELDGEACILATTKVIEELKQIQKALMESEEKYRLLVENANEAIVVIQDGELRFFNRRTEVLSGYTQSELRKRSFLELIHPDDQKEVLNRYIKRLQGEAVSNRNVFRIVDANGQVRWAEASTVMIQWQDHPAILNFLTDISERKRAEDALRNNEWYLRTIMATIQTGVMVIDDATHKVVDANPFAARILDCHMLDLVGRDWRKCLPSDGLDPHRSQLPMNGNSGFTSVLRTLDDKRVHVRRTSAGLTVRNRNLRIESFLEISDIVKLMRIQEVNIGLAKNILRLVNGNPDRNIPMANSRSLFVEVLSSPCNAEGGDHFFIRNIRNAHHSGPDRTFISLKDQSGHEVSCVLRSIITDLMHHAIINRDENRSVDDILRQLNTNICRSGLFQDDDFLTTVNAVVDHESIQLQYIAAGHPPFILVRENTVRLIPQPGENGTNPPVAITEDLSFEPGILQLKEGDRVVFYTDGLTEMPLRYKGIIITLAKLQEMVEKIVDTDPDIKVVDLMRHMLNRIADYSNEQVVPDSKNSSGDDITLLGFEVETTAVDGEKVLQPNSGRIQEHIDAVYDMLLAEWHQHGFEIAERLRIVLEEAILNAWYHGNQQDVRKDITIRWRFGNDFHLEVIDEGSGFDHHKLPNPTIPANLKRPTGRGIFLMRHVADALSWKNSGRHLVASFGKYSQSLAAWPLQDHRQLMDIWNQSRQQAA